LRCARCFAEWTRRMADETWPHLLRGLRERARSERARRAEERQHAYQSAKALQFAGSLEQATLELVEHAAAVRSRIERVRPIDVSARVLEVGSGAHGLIFFLGLENAVGVDPLADIYPALFPEWQRRAKTLRGYGEALPFEDASFDLVVSDNVIDHAERPETILTEIARVLRPGGTLYFTVHIHHPVYAAAASAHAAWNAMGVPYEIGPFADHTVHFTLRQIRARILSLPLHVLSEETGIERAKEEARKRAPRHIGDRLKRVFFKNAHFEIVAVRRYDVRPPVVTLEATASSRC
jgi:SAM-dependent methyltransferase